MRLFRADLHIHTLLSPCGDLDMSPARIVAEALGKNLDIICITDHNTTRQAELVRRIGEPKGLCVLTGAEVTTSEEVHCLVFFENTDTTRIFQEYLDENLPVVQNNPALFGHQVQVDEEENIVYEEQRLLHVALPKTINEVEKAVHSLGGLFIPAHADRPKNSIFSQLGFLPEDLNADAIEISRSTAPEDFERKHPEISKYNIIRSSDAHFPGDIGAVSTLFMLGEASFSELKMAFREINGRHIA